MDTIEEFYNSIAQYATDPKRERGPASLDEYVEYINPRVTSTAVAFGAFGAGLGKLNSNFSFIFLVILLYQGIRLEIWLWPQDLRCFLNGD